LKTVVAAVAFLAASAPGAGSAAPVPVPSPSPSPTPSPLTFAGFVRSTDYTVQTQTNPANGGPRIPSYYPSFTADMNLRLNYRFGASPISVGVSYLDAQPIGSCTTPSPPAGSTCINGANNLPGFPISTFMEAYVQYRGDRLFAKLGNQVINTPWATSATGAHIDPSSFQGLDVRYSLGNDFTIEGGDYVRFKPSELGGFQRITLLTGYPLGAAGLANNIYDPSGLSIQTNGIVYGRAGYAGADGIAANVYVYGMQDIANILWFDASLPLGASRFKPFVKLQGGSESNAGTAVIGKIDSSVLGVQAGVNFTPTLSTTVGYDGIPIHTDTVTLPAGYTCPGPGASGANVIAVNSLLTTKSLPYFLPTGGTGNCTLNANGTANLYDGGWASPYSDSYGIDPLFTTPTTVGLVDRRSPGSAVTARLTYTNPTNQFISYVSRTYFDYTTPAYAQSTYETDIDALYYFKRIPAGPYRGFLFHYRYAVQTQSGSATYSGTSQLTYNRFQLEYDF
jgi:hypothetical protein